MSTEREVPMQTVRNRPFSSAAFLLLIFMAILAGGAALRESITIDETAHIGAGVSYLQRFDLRLNDEHPPLPKMVAALPLVVRGVHADYSHISWTISEKFFPAYLGQWVFGEYLLTKWNNPKDTLAWARAPMLLLTADSRLDRLCLRPVPGRKLGWTALPLRVCNGSSIPCVRSTGSYGYRCHAVCPAHGMASGGSLAITQQEKHASFCSLSCGSASVQIHGGNPAIRLWSIFAQHALVSPSWSTSRKIRIKSVASLSLAPDPTWCFVGWPFRIHLLLCFLGPAAFQFPLFSWRESILDCSSPTAFARLALSSRGLVGADYLQPSNISFGT